MNEKTFKKFFPKVKLSVCPHEIQNFGNSVADISILGQFCTYSQFRGEKYLNTFNVTNANNCPNLLSHGATFRMGVLLPNYPEENVVKGCGENVPNFKISTSTSTSTGTSSNVFQILQDLRLKQYQENHPDSMQIESRMSHTSTHSTTGTLIQNIPQLTTSFRTTPNTATTGQQVNPVQVLVLPQDTSCKTHLESCMHVHQPVSQVCKPEESLALRKVKHPLNGRTSVSRLPLTKQDILSQYSDCFEGIGRFPGIHTNFTSSQTTSLHDMHQGKCYIVGLNCKFIDLLFKHSFIKFIEISFHLDFIVSEIICKQTDTLSHGLMYLR